MPTEAHAATPASKNQAAVNNVTSFDIQALFTQHQSNLLHFVRRHVRSNEDAEDVVQNTFVEAIRCSERFSGLSKPSTWLFGIALNLARNQVRRNFTDPSECVEDMVLEAVADFDASPYELCEQREMAYKVASILEELPTRIRETFEAVLEGECSYEEAAVALKIPPGTVRSRISRVRSTLRRRLRTLESQ